MSSVDVEKELQEFRTALDRYLHLLKGGTVDKKKAILVERIELELIGEVLPILEERKPRDAQEALDILSREGWLAEAIQRVGSRVEDPVEDPEEALRAFLMGDVDRPGAKAALITVQAVARAVARLREPVSLLSARCPVCGAESKTMVVRDALYMVCHFCGYQWIVSRGEVVCPYCGSNDPISIGVFTDKKRRIGLFTCQECGSTWRAVMDRSIKAPATLLPLIAMGAELFRRFAVYSLGDKYTGKAKKDAPLEEGEGQA